MGTSYVAILLGARMPGWVSLLRRAGELRVPAADRDELLKRLLTASELPRLELPESLRVEALAHGRERRGQPAHLGLQQMPVGRLLLVMLGAAEAGALGEMAGDGLREHVHLALVGAADGPEMVVVAAVAQEVAKHLL